MPWPDYYNLQPNTLFYLNHGVKGIFQEAAYQSYAGDLAPMKNYLMSKLLWDPVHSNATTIMTEFFHLYYGPSVGIKMLHYVQLWSTAVASKQFFMGESVPYTSSYLTPKDLLISAALTLPDPSCTDNQAKRLRIASLTTMYVVLLRWKEIQLYAHTHHIVWPYGEHTVADTFQVFSSIFTKDANATLLSEGGGHDLKWLKKELKL